VMLPPLFNWFDTLDEIAFPICQRTLTTINLISPIILVCDVNGIEPF